MAAIVYNGFQSCFESHHAIESRVLSLKLTPFPPSSSSLPFASHSIELPLISSFWDPNQGRPAATDDHIITPDKTTADLSSHDNNSGGGFGSLQSLSNATASLLLEPIQKQSTAASTCYVPPMAKRSSLVLSERSLQLCTENLGSETGTYDVTGNSIDSIGTDPYCGRKLTAMEQAKPVARRRTKKAIDMQNFPPPLTTISGPDCIRVRSHREEGRLVMEAVMGPSSMSCFQAERSHGRLRLCILKTTNSPVFDSENDEGNQGAGVECEGNDVIASPRQEMKQGGKVKGEAEDREHERGCCAHEGCEDTDGNKLKRGGYIGIENFERPRRYKEGQHECNGLTNREAVLVATS